jgi:integrase
VFADEIGRPLPPGSISKAFSRLVKAEELPPLSLHGLRHTFATLGLEAGVDTVYVSELLGHASPAITMQVYQHTRQQRLEGAVRIVGDAIFGNADANGAARRSSGVTTAADSCWLTGVGGGI